MSTRATATFEPGRAPPSAGLGRLVVVSNRVPAPERSDGRDRNTPVGGLVGAVAPGLKERGGLWFGWSGRSTQRRPDTAPALSRIGEINLATIDLSEDDVSLFYTGFANRTMWPLLHSFTDRTVIQHSTYRAYERINRRFAEALYPMLEAGDMVWVHDYHLFHLGRELRELGWHGKIGFFLHVPFPPADIFAILPWSRQILTDLLSYDLVGVHTNGYLRNLSDSLADQLRDLTSGTVFAPDGTSTFTHDGMSTRLGVYPAGIDPAVFQDPAGEDARGLAEQLSIANSPDHRIILAVDRLDYTKGIPQRLRAFERLLERNRSLRGNVTFVQISSPSRSRVPEYIQEKDQVDQLVGRINGRFSEGGWVPVRYLYRSYSQRELSRFYRDADVFAVTPLRDGMNLVAKEFVASQRENPGVLVLSRFSGAAVTLTDALLVNPYDVSGTAAAIYKGLRMSTSERKRRWGAMAAEVWEHTAQRWSDSFSSDLASA